MRVDADRVDVGRQHVVVLDRVIALAGRNIDRLALEPDEKRLVRGWRVAQKQSERGLRRLGLPRRQQVHLDDEVAAFVERPRAIDRLHERRLARRPAEDVLHFVVRHGGKPGLAVAAVEPSGHAQPIDADARVVQHPRIVGAQLDGAHVARFRDRNRD